MNNIVRCAGIAIGVGMIVTSTIGLINVVKTRHEINESLENDKKILEEIKEEIKKRAAK